MVGGAIYSDILDEKKSDYGDEWQFFFNVFSFTCLVDLQYLRQEDWQMHMPREVSTRNINVGEITQNVKL